MDTFSYKTISANSKTVNKEWLLVDAENEILGRFASEIAKMIRGKNKTNFTPHVDCGDNVIVIKGCLIYPYEGKLQFCSVQVNIHVILSPQLFEIVFFLLLKFVM